ncbi:hypothetical protein [Streptomyces sp. NPDC046631]|uniref:hypothetical protein n=1 Tax=unclassified Streptomyces TaxID=2593676 RepID=UPI0033ED93F6
MEFPIKVALAQSVPVLPEGPGWWYEPKLDGSPDRAADGMASGGGAADPTAGEWSACAAWLDAEVFGGLFDGPEFRHYVMQGCQADTALRVRMTTPR